MTDRATVERLDLAQIEPDVAAAGLSIELHDVIDSTNCALSGSRHRHRHVVLAEVQTAGRGRRGRSWQSPPYSGLCLSFGYTFSCGIERLGPLSLAVGIAAAETLRAETGQTIKIKWPNDLMRADKKLGGLLIEVQPDGPDQTRAIIGLGLNVRLPAAIHRTEAALQDAASGRGWTDLRVDDHDPPMRNRLAMQMSMALDRACQEYDRHGFERFAERWPALDYLAGRSIQAIQADGSRLEGTSDGIRADGALRLNTDSGSVALNAAEVSVRGR